MRSPRPFLVAVCLLAALALSQSAPTSATASSSDQTDITAIQQIEDEWLETERNTDLAASTISWPTISQESAPTDPLRGKHSF